ncbi:MAG: PQQ-binding-like beta-propeller repeat protein [Bacteriovoracaceae bacterium]|nr:PQQ-binding-like beta-propeller repeat protein [Bacteriovoracaceae bacterium]
MRFLPFLILFSGCSFYKSLKSIEFRPEHVKKEASFGFKKIWNRELDPIYSSGNLAIGYTSPLLSSDYLFLGNAKGTFEVYDLSNGRMMWSIDERRPLGSQPSRYEDQVIYGSYTGRLYSRHYLTGQLNYSIDLAVPIETAPLIYKDRIFIHSRNHSILSLDAKTGKILWSYRRAVPFTTTLHRTGRPIGVGNTVIVGFADGYLASFSVEEGVLRWETQIGRGQKFVDVDATPLYYRDRIWSGSAAGPLNIINPNNGAIERAIDLQIGHQPVVFKDKIYVGTLLGDVVQIDGNGTILKTVNLNQEGISSMSVWNDHLVAAGYDGRVRLMSVDELKVLEQLHLGTDKSVILGQMEVEKDFLAMYSSRNRLYVFKN